ncbi:MAG: tRNA preQ1(34) S-adenosylmethionine ribosyltransferase-isomerase QueA [Gammaproteobacteria bacterium]|nr:tRNA preQ1(34) S-adenosylmethionine ribosyltransferase-isomerase QueA [Gammaproteobacteria bacterium]
MKTSDYHYDLPQDLIAQHPLEQRSASCLLGLGRFDGKITDYKFNQLPELLQPGDLLVFNNTKVMHARLYGKKETGGQVEVLVERVMGEQRVLAHVRASKSPKPGSRLILEDKIPLTVLGRVGELFDLAFESEQSVIELLEQVGRLPLPPYIERDAADFDESRYQTIFADRLGAVAAPTAGLHFDEQIMQGIASKGIQSGSCTLHVGAGTFQPVRVDDIEDHHMHSEWLEVGEELVEKIENTKRDGGRVIAVGTTVVRCLESAALGGRLAPFHGDTDIFIYPGFEFKVIDGLITNFHLPGSTLLMLVSAFAGRDNILNAYRYAIEHKYRFFSYGDAMLIS